MIMIVKMFSPELISLDLSTIENKDESLSSTEEAALDAELSVSSTILPKVGNVINTSKNIQRKSKKTLPLTQRDQANDDKIIVEV